MTDPLTRRAIYFSSALLSPVVLSAALAAMLSTTGVATAQGSNAPSATSSQPTRATIERLRRDQDEILRKAERLQKLMERLMTRYIRENKQEQVDYLTEGLAHLERSGVLRDVATIREDLESTAFTEALRKQREVVDDLERLLNILLARKSIENIDDQIDQVTEQAKSARELERRQSELINAARDTMQSELSPAEQELADRLAELRDQQQREADRNAQQAGMRRPFLESTLARIEELLHKQGQLEAGMQDETAGRAPTAKTQAFDLGDLSERVRQLQRDLREQKQQQQLGQAGTDLQQAAASQDPQALQQARDRLDRLLENPPRLPKSPGEFKDRDAEWQKIREAAQAAPEANTESGQQALDSVGKQTEQHADQRNNEASEVNAAKTGQLKDVAEQLAKRMQQEADKQLSGQPASGQPAAGQPARETSAEPNAEAKRSADTVADAAKALKAAQKAMTDGDTDKADELVNKALSALDRARSQHRKENPDAARNASQMAAQARAAAQELANAPTQKQAEQEAGKDLQEAAKALREVASKVDEARSQAKTPNADEAVKQSRDSLEKARDTIQQALSNAAENNRDELQAAQERQQQLAQQAAVAKQQVAQAAKQGAINSQQQQAAQKAIDSAQQSMQQAQEQLKKGQQSGASQQQQQAAQQMQKAMDALQENRQLTPEQREQLAKQAEAQEQLTDDIIRLAKELKDRNNKNAERAVQEAADASRKAKRAMEEGDTEETQQQQEQARQKLEEAIDELEEEADRYQDLRQEELLFRMKDELTTFLEKQRPISEQTKQFQKSLKNGRLSRSSRRKVNGLGEEEGVLAGKIEFLVNALAEEGNLVYRSVLHANLEDLREVARRLAGRAPNVGSFTTLLQDDIVRRSVQLLEALEREMQRREEERQQQKQESKNKFNPQREKLVSLIAELEMLKNLGADTKEATDNLRTLVELRGDETINESEVAMIQRLAHRHNEITKLFAQIKAGVEEAMNAGEEEEGGEGH